MHSATHIDLIHLALMAIPVAVVAFVYVKWSLKVEHLLYAVLRMVVQLILVGYALAAIFNQSDPWVSSAVVCVMFVAASWIALGPIQKKRKEYFFITLLSLLIGGVPVLALVIVGVVQLDPWYLPRYFIPLAGMIFANAMNSVSLCAERFVSETEKGTPYIEARAAAYRIGLLPLINNFFAVGLVALPGMMTGQILAGVSPLLAVRYQIMVMSMVMGAAGIASACFLIFVKRRVIA